MAKGWVSLHRKTLENPVICKDSDYFSVWCYLLMNATHECYDAEFKGERITLKKGQLITGRKAISEKFNISESKVQRILKRFEIEQQIEQQTSSRKRLISIVNWSLYQGSEQQIEQRVNNKRTTSEQQVNTNNNVITKECNNANKKTSSSQTKFDEDGNEYRLAKFLYQNIIKNRPEFKKPNLQSWAKEFDKILRIDKRQLVEVKSLITWVQNDSFEMSNVMSPGKLRKRYDQLAIKMNRTSNTNQQSENPFARVVYEELEKKGGY